MNYFKSVLRPAKQILTCIIKYKVTNRELHHTWASVLLLIQQDISVMLGPNTALMLNVTLRLRLSFLI